MDFLRIVVMDGAGVAIREEGQDPGRVSDHRSGSLSPSWETRKWPSEHKYQPWNRTCKFRNTPEISM